MRPSNANNFDAIAKVLHGQAHMLILYFTTKILVYSAKVLFSCGNYALVGRAPEAYGSCCAFVCVYVCVCVCVSVCVSVCVYVFHAHLNRPLQLIIRTILLSLLTLVSRVSISMQ